MPARSHHPTRPEVDVVDRITEQWREVRPDVDTSPIEIVGRISRLSRLIDRRLGENFTDHGIEDWMYDVIATLYRSGEPHQLSAGELVRRTMVTTGAMTNRVDRLETLGLVRRAAAKDRRKVIVQLTDDGRRMVEKVVDSHLDTERSIIGALSATAQRRLATDLRTLLLALDDLPED